MYANIREGSEPNALGRCFLSVGTILIRGPSFTYRLRGM
jgi:hypothetical protein